MDRLVPALIIAGIVVLALSLMWWGWRGRQRRQAGLHTLPVVPHDAGDELLAVDGFYVATSQADNPLERIAVGGLGYRSRARLVVRETGVALEIPGQDALFLGFDRLGEVFRARHTIDRVVERDGLVVLRHRLSAAAGDPVTVDSYVRIVDPHAAASFVAEVAGRVSAGAKQ